MSKPKKIIRTKRLYKRRESPKWVGTLFFVLFLVVLVGLGFIVRKEWIARFGEGEATSSLVSSEPPPVSDTVSRISSETSSEPVSSQPEKEPLHVKGLRMSAEDLAKTGEQLSVFLAHAREAGFTAVYMDLKSDEGIITYDTGSEFAKQYGTVSQTPIRLDELVKAVKEAGLAPIGRISALKDPLSAHVRNENSFGYAGSTEVNWLDDSVANGGKPWLNPYMENTRGYLSGLCKEASDRGIVCIVLENVTFPFKNTEKMGTLNETVTRDQILGQLVSECQTAAGETPVFVSYTPVAMVRFGLEPIRAMGTQIAPTLDLTAIEANRTAITALLSPAATEPSMTANIVEAMLGSAEEAQADGPERLPLIPAAHLEAVRPILERLGYQSYIVL